MFKKIILLLFLLLVSGMTLFSQNRSGYIGKKNMVSVFTTSNVMFFNFVNNFLSDDIAPHYVSFNKDNEKKDKIQVFRIDYRVAYQRILSNRIAIGVEYAHEKVKLNSYSFNFYNPYNYTFLKEYSSPVYNANSFLLTAEFFQKENIAGQGFSIGIGVGPKLYSFNTKQNYRIDENTPLYIDEVDSKLNYLAINAYYQMTYRHPINSFLSFEIGLRFHSGLVLRKNYNNNFEESYLWSESTIYRELGRLNSFNLASLKTGFVILI